ncbi:S49 family peptidase, partial [Myxococcota bacterium]|nr:S49 family peptidase [Myxococcota bacterium]
MGKRITSWGGGGGIRRIRARRAVQSRAGCWLDVRVDGPFSEYESAGPEGKMLGFLDLLRTIEAGASDPRFDGLIVRMTGRLGSFGQAAALARMVTLWRNSGRRVVVWARGLSIEEYAMVAEADALWMPESAELQLIGLSIERFFLKGLLDQLGVRPEVVHVGRYKSAGETLTRQGMSETEREQIDLWQGDVFDALVRSIASGRGLSEHAVRDRIDQGPYPARLALEAGLIDGIAYADELDERLQEEALKIPSRGSQARRAHRVDRRHPRPGHDRAPAADQPGGARRDRGADRGLQSHPDALDHAALLGAAGPARGAWASRRSPRAAR